MSAHVVTEGPCHLILGLRHSYDYMHSERIERLETYKQWQIRNLRAGFRQLPLDREIFNMAKEKIKSCYHKDYMVDEDGQWLVQGWKGRIIFAISSWKPV